MPMDWYAGHEDLAVFFTPEQRRLVEEVKGTALLIGNVPVVVVDDDEDVRREGG